MRELIIDLESSCGGRNDRIEVVKNGNWLDFNNALAKYAKDQGRAFNDAGDRRVLDYTKRLMAARRVAFRLFIRDLEKFLSSLSLEEKDQIDGLLAYNHPFDCQASISLGGYLRVEAKGGKDRDILKRFNRQYSQRGVEKLRRQTPPANLCKWTEVRDLCMDLPKSANTILCRVSRKGKADDSPITDLLAGVGLIRRRDQPDENGWSIADKKLGEAIRYHACPLSGLMCLGYRPMDFFSRNSSLISRYVPALLFLVVVTIVIVCQNLLGDLFGSSAPLLNASMVAIVTLYALFHVACRVKNRSEEPWEILLSIAVVFFCIYWIAQPETLELMDGVVRVEHPGWVFHNDEGAIKLMVYGQNDLLEGELELVVYAEGRRGASVDVSSEQDRRVRVEREGQIVVKTWILETGGGMTPSPPIRIGVEFLGQEESFCVRVFPIPWGARSFLQPNNLGLPVVVSSLWVVFIQLPKFIELINREDGEKRDLRLRWLQERFNRAKFFSLVFFLVILFSIIVFWFRYPCS